MKYLAILRDSLREAIDTKVLYVMVGLSVLLVLFILSCRFDPLPAKRFFDSTVSGSLSGGLGDPDGRAKRGGKKFGGGGPQAAPADDPLVNLGFDVIDAKATDGDDDSPSSTYTVTVRARAFGEEAGAALQKSPQRALELLRKRLERAEELKRLRALNLRVAGRSNPAVAADKFQHAVYLEFTAEPMANTVRLWPHDLQLGFGSFPLKLEVPLGLLLYGFASTISSIGGWVTLIISIVMTAFFIPNMMRKGTIDLLLVKPIQRPVLLLYKYLGGLTFIFINTTVAIGGTWLALGLRSGVWANNFLWMILIVTFFFAILYAVSTLFGVVTHSPIVSILLTCGAWFVFFVVGASYNFVDMSAQREEIMNVPEDERWTDNVPCQVIRVIHFVTPRTGDLNRLSDIMLARDFLSDELVREVNADRTSITWGESLTVSLAFIAVMLGAACWWFQTTDY
jgi:ABC-type transport system involved in multi-copper enzyme maturation permease subunit